MFGVKISSVLAGGILVLGSSAIALAQAGGPPEELPQEAAQDAQDEVSTLELGNETATNAVENRGEGDSDGDGTAFSDWVKSLELDGCERGLTIAANAKNGPTDFDPGNAVTADPDHPAIAAGCADETQNGFSGDNLPDEERGAEFGRQTAEENSGGASELENENADAGPPSDPGPPSGAGPSGDAGPPSDPGPPNGS